MIFRWIYTDDLLVYANTDRLLRVCSDILKAYRDGKHLIVMDRALADFLCEQDFGRLDITTIRSISSRFPLFGNLHRKAAIYVEICNTFDAKLDLVEGCYSISLGSLLGKPSLLDVSTLLLENSSNDGWVYNAILEVVSTRAKLGHYRLEFDHGGGEDIVKVFKSQLDDDRFVLALVDSDKNAPSSRMTTKVSQMEDILRRHRNKHGYITALPVREVENLIPLDLLLKIPSARNVSSCGHLLNININEDVDDNEIFIKYFDYKEGICSDRLSRLKEHEINWIIDKISKANINYDNFNLPGFGDRILPQLSQGDGFLSLFRKEINKNIWYNRYGGFFEHIFWYFVSVPRTIT